jgi:uncharacterized protein affecting Mg2+/Co2+ transport
MKNLACLTLFLLGTASLQSAPRVFTSTDGKSITADLVGANGLQATLKLADGRETVVSMNRLSQVDQEFITAWVKQNPQTIRYNFSVEAAKEKVDSKVAGSRFSIESSTVAKWLYHVKVTNRASQPMEGVKMRYQIHYTDVDGKVKNTEYKFGVKDLPPLKPGESINVDTDPVDLVSIKLEGGYMYSDGSRPRQTDTIKGLAVTLEHNGKSVFEFTTTGVKKVSESPEKKVAGQR